jgi:hypothetical protein
MRRALLLAVVGVGMLVAPCAALAVPTVTFKAHAEPITGFPHTGLIYGAGAAVLAEYTIEGTEYFGSPPPIIGVNFYLPKHTELHPSGFPTCDETIIRQQGPIGCPNASQAGPVGQVLGFVTFGGERVEEETELFSFYKPGGGLTFFDVGHTPTSLEVYSNGHFVNLHGAGGFGPELETKVPLVPSVPGAPFASVKSITVKSGSAIKSHGKTIYYGRVPKRGQCPHTGFEVKTEVIFAENGEESKPVTVTKTYKGPCPTH